MKRWLTVALGTGGLAAVIAAIAAVALVLPGGQASAAPEVLTVETTQPTTEVPDTTGPFVELFGGPADGATVTVEPTFTFASFDEDVDHLECSFDAGTYATCVSPVTPGLGRGTHTLSIRGVDTSRNTGDVVTRAWTLRDIPCEDATAAFDAAKVKMQEAKQRLHDAHAAHDPQAVQQAKAHKHRVRLQRVAAKAAYHQECAS